MSLIHWILFSIIFYYSKSRAQNSTSRTPPTEDLVSVLESVYCTGKADMTPCNIAEGKVCYREICISACAPRSLAPCECSSDSRCSVCCNNARSACSPASTYGVYDPYGLPWFRQNTIDACSPVIGTGNPQCPVGHEGKICDLKKTAQGLEEPWICLAGQCSPLPCAGFNLVSPVVACGCRDNFKNYSVCCTDLTNATCFPFQIWLRAPQGQGYMDAIGVRQVTLAPVTYPTATVTMTSSPSTNGNGNNGGDLYSVNCNYVSSEGRKCGSASQCFRGQCRHACNGQSESECYCSPESGYDCHVCCLQQDNACVSANGNLSNPTFVRTSGQPCGNSFLGRCSRDGVCQDPAVQFCQDPKNEAKMCRTNSVCRNGQCRHVCGSTDGLCYCNPGTNEECHLCCFDPATQTCQSANLNTTDFRERFYQPFGQMCNFTLGTCSTNGVCQPFAGHPLAMPFCQRPDNEGRSCSQGKDGYVCVDKVCQPFCPNVSDLCQCPTTGGQECHLCCRNATTNACQSVVAQSEPKPRFRSYGTPCDGGRGACDHSGKCQLLPSYCTDTANEYKRCGDKNVCIRGQCRNLCVDEDACVCPNQFDVDDPNNQCKVCCYTKSNNSCHVASAFALPLPNLAARPSGTVCKSGNNEGYCTYNGTCSIIYAMLDESEGGVAATFASVACVVLEILCLYFIW